MFNVETGNIYEVWVNGVLLTTTVLLKEKMTKLVFTNFAIERTAINALRRVA